MATPAAPVEHTAELALSEKRKLVKSLGHLDMVLFTVCAIVGLDVLGRLRFEVFTLGTLGVVIAFALVGYLAGRSVREQVVEVPLAATPAPAAGD